MTGEVLKGGGLAVLLPHKEQRYERRKDHGSGGELQSFKFYQATQTVTAQAIANLIVILRKDHESGGRNVARGVAVPSLPVGGKCTRVSETFSEGFSQMVELTKVAVISGLFSCQQGVESMMKVIVPLSVESITTCFRGTDHARVVEVTLGDHIDPAANALRLPMHGARELSEKGLRAKIDDAIEGIIDLSAQPFLAELARAVHGEAKRTGRRIYLIAESDLNDARVIRPPEAAGYGLDAQWNDDFHHALHALLTGEKAGYYRDYGELDQLAKAFREGFVYSGDYSAYRKRRHGNSSRDIAASRFVVFAQNHDQIGNRMRGDRLSCLVKFEALKLAAGAVILSPFIPLVFMGEEYGETAPFQYFTSHSDPSLVEAVRRGRQEEFAAFEWQGDAPDPQAESSFVDGKLDHALRDQEPHATLWKFYHELIKLRQHRFALRQLSKQHSEVTALMPNRTLVVRRWSESEDLVIAFNFGSDINSISAMIPTGSWRVELDSASHRWRGPGSLLGTTWESTGDTALELNPESFAVLSRPK